VNWQRIDSCVTRYKEGESGGGRGEILPYPSASDDTYSCGGNKEYENNLRKTGDMS
jgi:hypothetical protein